MAEIPGGVRVGGFMSPTDDTDVYPTHDSLYGKGGSKEVADIAARDAITTDRRREGLLCYCVSDAVTYQLVGGVTNAHWVPFAGGGGGLAKWVGLTAYSEDDVIWHETDSCIYVCINANSDASFTPANWQKLSDTIGDAEDGSYTDGLFIDFTPNTPIGIPIDRFNEVLGSLAPPPAPALSDMSFSQSGVSGKLSFGTSNAIAGYSNAPIDINIAYSNSGDRKGIFAPAVKSGVLADTTVAHAAGAYPANSFGSGDSGTLELVVNGVTVHSVDLSVFGSGNSLNGNGSGFNLSVATSVEFPSGDPFDMFKYRTGTWTVAVADQRNGYNYVQVTHSVGGAFTQTYDWVNDAETTATVISSPNMDNLTMTGSKYLSGAQYHTGGTAQYDVVVNSAYRNTYSMASNALNFVPSNGVMTDQSIGNMVTEASAITITNALFTITSTRLLNSSISTTMTVDRTVQADINTGSYDSISGILLDNVADNATDTIERLNGEGYRMHSGLSLTNTNYGTGMNASDYDYDETVSLVGADANYNDGLLVNAGLLEYPTRGPNSGNFSTISNGPAGNVDYSAASGNRVFYRYFYNTDPKQNCNFNVSCSSTSFVSVATGPGGNNLTFEVLAPNTTQDGGATVEFKDAVVPYTDIDAIGCYGSSFGSTIPSDWGVTLGSRNTSTSGGAIVVRITASSAWTGNISQIQIEWL